MGVNKVNTTDYYPQVDGLVELFNRTLQDMLSKTTERDGSNWDDKLSFVLFAYWTSVQESTQGSLFFLLYGRDPVLPSEIFLRTVECCIELGSYKEELVIHLRSLETC